MMPILSLSLISVIRCRIPVPTHLTCNCNLFYPCLHLQAAQHVRFPQGHERRLGWSKGQILPCLTFLFIFVRLLKPDRELIDSLGEKGRGWQLSFAVCLGWKGRELQLSFAVCLGGKGRE